MKFVYEDSELFLLNSFLILLFRHSFLWRSIVIVFRIVFCLRYGRMNGTLMMEFPGPEDIVMYTATLEYATLRLIAV